MEPTSLRRTVRRCVALLLAPVSLLLAVISRYLASPYGSSAPMDVLVVGRVVGLLLFVGAAGYVIGSVALGLLASGDSRGSDSERERGA